MQNSKIIIAGRTNVGKSTLFNRLIGRKQAIVGSTEHVTRDYIESEALGCALFDTAGLVKDTEDPFMLKTLAILAEARLVFFVVDGKSGITAEDRECLKKVRRHTKAPIQLLVNKADCKITELQAPEFHALGFNSYIKISAEHGTGIEEVINLIRACNDDEVESSSAVRMAIIGQPNAGKSSLTNFLLGSERMVVSDIPGTTREAVSSTFFFKDQAIILTDNAGTRRRYSRDQQDLENLSMRSAVRAVEESDVVLVLVDAARGEISSQDLRLADVALSRYKPIVIAANKCDIALEKSAVMGKLEDISRSIFLDSPVVPISAKTGANCHALIAHALRVYRKNSRKLSAHVLKEWLAQVMLDNPPRMSLAKRVTRLKHITQYNVSPPKFKITLNTVEDNLGDSYKRYLTNRLRSDFALQGIPIFLRIVTSKNPHSKQHDSLS